MSLLSCEHVIKYKQEKGTHSYTTIFSLFISNSTEAARTRRKNEGFCNVCKTRSRRLHVCWECLLIGCFEGNHIHDHVKDTGHHIGVDITFGNIYCFICNDYMYDVELKRKCVNNQINVFWQPNETEAKLYKDYVAKEKIVRTKFLGLRGLVNLGQTCYMNCIVQILTHNPLLRNYFLSAKHNIYTCHHKANRDECLACEMDALFQEFYSGQSIPLIPHKLYMMWKKLIRLEGYAPQDAHEFFITLLEILHQHLRGPNGEDSDCQCIIHKIYTGFLQSDIHCEQCKNKRTIIEEFRDICLDLGVTNGSVNGSETISLVDCLHRYTRPEQVQSKCESCEYGSSTKQIMVQKLPVVISFHLRRLEYGKKITTFVSFPEYLDMTPFVSSNRGLSPDTHEQNNYSYNINGSDNHYCLFAVVNHSGNKEGGHYIAFIKRKHKWYKCDDDIITLASLHHVLKSEGYILFYHKELLEYEKNSD